MAVNDVHRCRLPCGFAWTDGLPALVAGFENHVRLFFFPLTLVECWLRMDVYRSDCIRSES